MKIAILGYSGSGKSTLAAYLGKQYHTSCLHLDQIQFTANWQTRSDAAAKAMVTNFMKKSDWIIEGNYTRYFQAERLEQADQIILLLFPRHASLWRVFKRTLRYYHKTRPDMAENSPEHFSWDFFWWIIWEGRSKSVKKHYQEIGTQYSQKVVVIQNQRQLAEFYKLASQRSN